MTQTTLQAAPANISAPADTAAKTADPNEDHRGVGQGRGGRQQAQVHVVAHRTARQACRFRPIRWRVGHQGAPARSHELCTSTQGRKHVTAACSHRQTRDARLHPIVGHCPNKEQRVRCPPSSERQQLGVVVSVVGHGSYHQARRGTGKASNECRWTEPSRRSKAACWCRCSH